MNTAGLLSIARTALSAYQVAIDVTGQNVANADVEGYSRQRLDAAAGPSVYMANVGYLGTGVRIAGIERTRDALLDQTYRTQRGDAEGARFGFELLSQVEGVVGEPSATGLAASLDAFWTSWSDFATNPGSSGARGIVQQRGQQLAATLNRFASQVDEIDRVTRERLSSLVGDANASAREIAQINTLIVSAEAGGQSANDLRDARDRAVDRLAQFGSVETVERGDGSMAVYVGGLLTVDASSAKEFAVQSVGGSTQVVFRAQPAKPISSLGGQLASALDAINRQLPGVVRELDAVAATLVDTVNGIHTTGVTWSGTPPVATAAPDFFRTDAPAATPLYRTARYIRLSDAVAASADNVAGSAATATGPSNNEVSLQLAKLRDAKVAVRDPDGTARGTDSFGSYWRGVATKVGLAVRGAETDATVRQTLAESADARRQSVSGVSTDEELVSLIKQQQAFAAAARLVTVADEMSQTLINLGR